MEMRRAALTPLDPHPGTDKPWFYKCSKCGREVQRKLTVVGKSQHSCSYCAGKAVDNVGSVRDKLAAGTLSTMMNGFPDMIDAELRGIKCNLSVSF